jgi:hypothetical protein
MEIKPIYMWKYGVFQYANTPYILTVYENFSLYPYPFDRTWVLADRIYMAYIRSEQFIHRIWTVLQMVHPRESGLIYSNSSHFALVGQNIFLSPHFAS